MSENEKLHYVTAQLIAPCRSYPDGKIAEGFYLRTTLSSWLPKLASSDTMPRENRSDKSLKPSQSELASLAELQQELESLEAMPSETPQVLPLRK